MSREILSSKREREREMSIVHAFYDFLETYPMFTAVNKSFVTNLSLKSSSRIFEGESYRGYVSTRIGDSKSRSWITVQFVTTMCIYIQIYPDQQTHISISSNERYRGTKSGSLFPSINRPHSRRRTMTVTRRSAINCGDRSRHSRGTRHTIHLRTDKIGFRGGAQLELSSAAPPPI